MLFEQGLRQTLSQKIDPKLIMANSILQLSSLELQQVIEQELAENPRSRSARLRCFERIIDKASYL